MNFDILYSKSSTGKIIEWFIHVEEFSDHSDIITQTGQIDGIKTKHIKQIFTGKNIGKKNETTHFTQAIQEAQSKWTKRKETSFLKIDDFKTLDIELKPMLAHKYHEYKHKLKFPVFIQPKLDGYRGIYNPSTNKFYTRTGKEFSNVDFLLEKLKKLSISNNYILDGELYNHDFKFEDFGSLRKTKNKSENVNIEYHIYDLIDLSNPNCLFADRLNILKQLIKPNNSIKIVDTKLVENEHDIDNIHKIFLEMNYEGSIIRNNAVYKKNFRSYDLLKLKNFDDAEYQIIGFEEEQDSLTNEKLIIFICETNDKKQFKVGSKGTKLERKILLEKVKKNPEDWIGKMLSVQYFGLTDKGIPRFPKTLRNITISIRNDDL